MFTGLIEHVGKVKSLENHGGGRRLVVECADLAHSSRAGDSIAVNGVCLTALQSQSDHLSFDLIPETLARSNLGSLDRGGAVNLEASLRLGDPLGGHFVYGHVDATTAILRKEPEGPGYRLWCATPPRVCAMIVEKGYVALDGVSLTVAETLPAGSFAIALIPETLARTTLGRKGVGDMLNLEADPIARYVAHLVAQMK